MNYFTSLSETLFTCGTNRAKKPVAIYIYIYIYIYTHTHTHTHILTTCDVSYKVYICSSVRRNSRLKKSNKMQQHADIYLLLNYSTCFGRPSLPTSGVHKTVVAASGTDHTVWGASFFKRDQMRTHYMYSC